MNPAQKAMLNQRLALLDAFVLPEKDRKQPLFTAGQLTIVDLSDPFIEPTSACSLFEMVTRLFVRSQLDTGKVLVVDEAHKVSRSTSAQGTLTKSFLVSLSQPRGYRSDEDFDVVDPPATSPRHARCHQYSRLFLHRS